MVHTFRPARLGRSNPLGEKFMGSSSTGHELAWTNVCLTEDGKPLFGIAGEIHYSRLEPCRWEDALLKMRSCGINVVSTYVFWIHHEEVKGRFEFHDRRDLRCFVMLCGKLGLKVILRIGPFNHGEVRNGGLPDWIYGMPFEPRSTDPEFLKLVKTLYGKVSEQVQGLLYRDGGPVIALQLDNEYMHSAALWEDTRGTTNEYALGSGEGDSYILALKKLCGEVGLHVPFYTCTAWGGAAAPYTECIPLWGGYPYAPWLITKETPAHPPTEEYLYRDCRHENCKRYHSYDPQYPPSDMPFACCEMGGGMQVSYTYRFLVDPRSVDALANVKVGSGCNFVGYYMFCGGTNPTGNTVRYLHELWCPKLSYDYQAPVGEFGQIRDSYRRLRLLHGTLNTFAEALSGLETSLSVGTEDLQAEDTDTLRCSARRNESMGFLFLNNFQDHVKMQAKRDIVFEMDCENSTIRIPDQGTLSLAEGESCILPFGLHVLGDTLIYATLQPVYILKTVTGERWFCFRPEGMRGEMVFRSGSKVIFGSQDMEEKSETLPWGILSVVCFSRNAAMGLQKADLRGRTHIIWCEDTITFNDKGVWVETDQEEAKLTIWPPVDNDEGLSPNKPMTNLSVHFPPSTVQAAVYSLSDTRHVLTVPKDSLNGLYDILLSIEYEGDAAQLFLNGEMLADHFHNGEVWAIGLKQLNKCLGKEMVLHIVPMKTGVKEERDAMAAVRETVCQQNARLISVSARPIYRKKIY